jgi:hypothetical protein
MLQVCGAFKAENDEVKIMLRKKAIRRQADQQENAQGTTTRRAEASATTLLVLRGPAAARRTIKERLNSAARQAFQNMGED